MAPLERGAHIW